MIVHGFAIEKIKSKCMPNINGFYFSIAYRPNFRFIGIYICKHEI